MGRTSFGSKKVVSKKRPLISKNIMSSVKKTTKKRPSNPVTTVVMNKEAVKESHGDALDIRESSPFLHDSKEKRVMKRREWTSDTFSGSAKDIKRVVTRKIPRPSSNLVIATAEIHNEEGQLRIKPSDSKKKIHVSKTNTGQFQFKKQPCIFYGPDTIEVLESIEIPEREPKKDEISKNISNNIENLNRNAISCDSTKETRQIIQNQRSYSKKSDASTAEEYSLIDRREYVSSKSDQQAHKKRPLCQKDINNNDFSEAHVSSAKKTKKRKLRIASDYDEALRQEKTPSKLAHSPVMRGRSRISQLRPEYLRSVPDESSVNIKRRRVTVEHFEPEECSSEPEQSPGKKGRTMTRSCFDKKKSASKDRSSRSENNSEAGPLRIAKKKSSMSTNDIPHQNHFGPEASVIASETSPKKITQVIGDQLNHSGQKDLSAKAKAPKNKRAAPVDNNEVQSDFGENSVSTVIRKENKMTVSKKKNRHSRSEKLSTQDKQSKDIIYNENIFGSANGLRRSSRYRVPPLDIWRNERIVYEKLPSGEFKCKIEKGTEADDYGIRTILRKQKARKMKLQGEKIKNVTKTPILDIKTGETVHTIVHKPLESLQWAVLPNEDTYKLAKTFTSESKSFGFIDVFPFSTMEKQYSPVYNLHFVVVKGHLEVTIQDTSLTFKVGDSWIVPVGVPYSITNCLRTKALLSFSAFKEE
ncbi:CENP-C_C domain-containing protein [Trichonephila clavipes]|nr:CENP-C_C domain-containing protein [Trichonephila clavipes]